MSFEQPDVSKNEESEKKPMTREEAIKKAITILEDANDRVAFLEEDVSVLEELRQGKVSGRALELLRQAAQNWFELPAPTGNPEHLGPDAIDEKIKTEMIVTIDAVVDELEKDSL